MALSFACPEVLRDCPCDNFPVRNFSSESADLPVALCNVTVAATAGTFFAPPCQAVGESPVSDEDCEEATTRAAQDCSGDPPTVPPDGGFPVNLFTNSQQSCTVECPDGTTFSWIVPAGTIKSFWQADVDARAHALACKRATEHRLCFSTDTPLSNGCAGTFTSIVIGVFGGTSPYTFALTSGSLPAGLTLDSVGLITGTPTASGLSTFTITVTDNIGSTQVKEFTMRVIEITSPSALPDATVGSAYSETLTSVGNTFPVSWAVTAGSLPGGLSMPATGVISGTPTTAGDYSFTATITDFDNNSCSKDFTIHVAAQVSLEAYWAMEALSGGTLLLDSTANGANLDTAFTGSIVAGIVANGFHTVGPSSFQTLGAGTFSQPSSGFTFAGWVKLDFDTDLSVAYISEIVWDVTHNTFLQIDNGIVRFQVRTALLEFLTAEAPAINDGGWHFYRTWYDPSDGKSHLQIDNGTIHSSVDTGTMPGGLTTHPNIDFAFSITAVGTNEWTFDETGLWMRVLSTTEASNLYNGGAGITFGNPNMPP